MPSPPSASQRASSSVTVFGVHGIGEVVAGDDVAALVVDALTRDGIRLVSGDCLVISSKVASKALGLTWSGSKEDAVAAGTVRVVAERWADGRATQVVESVAGPVMAAAGVDASNTGASAALLLLPDDPDAVAARVRSHVVSRLGLEPSTPFAVVLSDTAGRPWRGGLTDFALGSAGLRTIEDLRGGADHDGRPLSVTTRAVADEVAAAADLVKGKADGIPAAVVRGLDPAWFDAAAEGARPMVRTGPGDWFAMGHVEAVRAALGAAPGSAAAREVGIASTGGGDDIGLRVSRVVALALLEVPDGSADVEIVGVVGVDGAVVAEVALAASDDYELGRLVTRLEVAAHSEGLRATVLARGATSVTVTLSTA
jgi:coenzyme F420-0:L-glutamate ligase / coenzyme F420-1:gamma-L-glutamate ligase